MSNKYLTKVFGPGSLSVAGKARRIVAKVKKFEGARSGELFDKSVAKSMPLKKNFDNEVAFLKHVEHKYSHDPDYVNHVTGVALQAKRKADRAIKHSLLTRDKEIFAKKVVHNAEKAGVGAGLGLAVGGALAAKNHEKSAGMIGGDAVKKVVGKARRIANRGQRLKSIIDGSKAEKLESGRLTRRAKFDDVKGKIDKAAPIVNKIKRTPYYSDQLIDKALDLHNSRAKKTVGLADSQNRIYPMRDKIKDLSKNIRESVKQNVNDTAYTGAGVVGGVVAARVLDSAMKRQREKKAALGNFDHDAYQHLKAKAEQDARNGYHGWQGNFETFATPHVRKPEVQAVQSSAGGILHKVKSMFRK